MLFWISVYNLQASPTNNQKLQIQNCKFLMRGSSATLNESIKHCSYTTASKKRDVANNRIIEWSKIFTQIIEDIRMIEDIHVIKVVRWLQRLWHYFKKMQFWSWRELKCSERGIRWAHLSIYKHNYLTIFTLIEKLLRLSHLLTHSIWKLSTSMLEK